MQRKLPDDMDEARTAPGDVEPTPAPVVVNIVPAVSLQLRGTLRAHHWAGYKEVMNVIEVLLLDQPDKWAVVRKRLLDIANKGANEQESIIVAVLSGFSKDVMDQVQKGDTK